MRRYGLQSLIFLGLALVVATPAAARDWTILFQLDMPQVGSVEVGDEVTIPDLGGTVSGTNIPGFTVTYIPATQSFTVRIDGDFELTAQCTADVLITGSATVTGSSSLLATGTIQSNSFNRCVLEGQLFTTNLPISGTFRAVSASGDATTVDAVITGTINVIDRNNRMGQLAAGTMQLRPGITLVTGPGDRVVLTFGDGSVVEVEQNSRFVIETDDLWYGLNLFLADGFARIRVAVASSLGKRFQVRTPSAVTSVRGTEYTVRHEVNGALATTTVTVAEGLVDVEGRDGDFFQVSAGGSRSLTTTADRVSLLLPVDEYPFALGTLQWFSWTAFAGAGGYLLEAITDPPGFYDTNPADVESGSVRLPIPLSQVYQAEGVVQWGLDAGPGTVPPGTIVWWRVFPADEAGRILPGVTASDAAMFVVQ